LRRRTVCPRPGQSRGGKKKFELIAILINEQLLLQKGKELDFTQRVEDEVNKRMLQVARENNIKTIEELCQAMKQSGVSCEDTRRTMRIEIMKQAVLESEVDQIVFLDLAPTLCTNILTPTRTSSPSRNRSIFLRFF
jgi:hypothetical protein